MKIYLKNILNIILYIIKILYIIIRAADYNIICMYSIIINPITNKYLAINSNIGKKFLYYLINIKKKKWWNNKYK